MSVAQASGGAVVDPDVRNPRHQKNRITDCCYCAGVVSAACVSFSASLSAERGLAFLLEGSGGVSCAGSKKRIRPQELQVTICWLERISCQFWGRIMTKQAMHFWSRASAMADLRCRITRS